MDNRNSGASPSFKIFRACEAVDLPGEAVTILPLSPTTEAGIASVERAGASEGRKIQVVFEVPGFSLALAWFKSGYPVPLHKHDVACLYYICSGSIRVGTEMLGVGDGFFVGADVPYSYTAGPTGVEVLEFRNVDHFNIEFLAKGAAFWNRATAQISGRQEQWSREARPSEKV